MHIFTRVTRPRSRQVAWTVMRDVCASVIEVRITLTDTILVLGSNESSNLDIIISGTTVLTLSSRHQLDYMLVIQIKSYFI